MRVDPGITWRKILVRVLTIGVSIDRIDMVTVSPTRFGVATKPDCMPSICYLLLVKENILKDEVTELAYNVVGVFTFETITLIWVPAVHPEDPQF